MAESPAAIVAVELVDFHPGHVLDPLDDELGDAVATAHVIGGSWVGVHHHRLQLAPVMGIDEAGGVHQRDAVVQCEAAARKDEARPPHRNGDGDAGGHERTTTIRCQFGVLAGVEIHSRIPRVRGAGQWKPVIQSANAYLNHPHTIFTPARQSATIGPGNRVVSVLVWMDLEMTGLDPVDHVIVEIATLVTDDELNIVAEGPDLVVHQPAERLAVMDDFVTNMHKTSGLLELIHASTVSEAEAMTRTLEFIKQHSPEPGKIPLAGNSIRTDRSFLAKYMPEIENWLHYRCVDVSTVKELVKRWYPGLEHTRPSTGVSHRAMDDIRDSVAELRYYREKVFRGSGGPAEQTP